MAAELDPYNLMFHSNKELDQFTHLIQNTTYESLNPCIHKPCDVKSQRWPAMTTEDDQESIKI